MQQWQVILIARMIRYWHKHPPHAREQYFSTKHRTSLLDFFRLQISSNLCGAGFRYNFHYCLGCGTYAKLLVRTEHPLLNYCNECRGTQALVTKYQHNKDMLVRDNPAVGLLYCLDLSLQEIILNKLFDLGTHSK